MLERQGHEALGKAFERLLVAGAVASEALEESSAVPLFFEKTQDPIASNIR